MTSLTHTVSGHRITTDDKSVAFWEAAGYRVVEAKKAPAKKAASPKKSSK